MDTFEYIKTLAHFREEIPEALRPSWIQMTTITMFSKHILAGIDLAQVRNAFQKLETITIKPKGSTKGFQWRMKLNSFYNQVSIGYVDSYSTKSIKLFSNGSIQVAGCSNVLDCKRVVSQIKLILEFILERPIDMPFSSFKVVMINTNFSVNHKIHIYNLIRNMSKNPMFEVMYEPGNYSGVNSKFCPMPGMKKVTTNIFSTGNVILTGAETLMEIAHAYKIINAVMLQADVLLEPSQVIKTFDTTMGAKFTEWLRVIPKKDPVLVKKRMDALYARTAEYEIDGDDVMELMHICSDFCNYAAYDKLCAAGPSDYDLVFAEVYKMLK